VNGEQQPASDPGFKHDSTKAPHQPSYANLADQPLQSARRRPRRLQNRQPMVSQPEYAVPAGERAGEVQERVVHGDQPFVSDRQPQVPSEPGDRALHLPSVLSELVRGLDALPCDAVLDAAPHAGVTATAVVIPSFCVQLLQAAPGPPARFRANRDHRVQHRLQHPAVMQIGGGHRDRERDDWLVHDEVVLAPGLALVGRMCSDGGSPFFATKLRLSRLARVQSILSAAAKRSSMHWCRFRHTPRRCHSRSRRHQVTPEPYPSSVGTVRHGMPERSTYRMPFSVARSSTHGRPHFGYAWRFGSSGATIAHNSFVSSGFMSKWYRGLPLRL
jgi:hypothetical protein